MTDKMMAKAGNGGDTHQTTDDVITADTVTFYDMQKHTHIGIRVTQTIDG